MISANHFASSFDMAISGFPLPSYNEHNNDLLEEIARILKPGGKFYAVESITDTKTDNQIESKLKLSGFISIEQVLKIL